MDSVEAAFQLAESTAVIVMAPGDCVACNNAIGDWLAWGAGTPRRETVVLLTEQPSAQESKLLRGMRIHWVGILTTHSDSKAEPRVLLAVGGAMRYSATGQRGMLDLIRRVSPRP